MADINTDLLINGKSAMGMLDSAYKFVHESLWDKVDIPEHYEEAESTEPNALQVVATEEDIIYVEEIPTGIAKTTLVANDSEKWNDVATDGSVYVKKVEQQSYEKEKYLKNVNSYNEDEITAIFNQALEETSI